MYNQIILVLVTTWKSERQPLLHYGSVQKTWHKANLHHCREGNQDKRRNEAPEQKAAQLAAALDLPLYSGRTDNAL